MIRMFSLLWKMNMIKYFKNKKLRTNMANFQQYFKKCHNGCTGPN